MIEKLVVDIHIAVRAATGRKKPEPDRRYHRHEEYITYGLKAAGYYDLLKKFHHRLLDLSLSERLDLAEKLLATNIGELGHFGIHAVAMSTGEMTPCDFEYIDRLIDYFHSWSHVDSLCGNVMTPMLCSFEDETIELFENWSRSPNRFRRRASVVTFTRNVAKSGDHADTVIRLCDNLIWDTEDIVRKGAGWALKDNLRAAPDTILPYIKKLRRMGVSSTITLYAIRGLKGQQRQDVLAVKKKA